MKLIVGLGNIGLKYKQTRHNVGFMFIDQIAKDLNINLKLDKNFKGLYCKTKIGNTDVIFLKPATYMNLSGESVILVKKYFNIDDEDILIIHDDMDLPIGKVRIRANGSSAGQKGMNNIIENLKTSEIKRIRIGIDKGEDSINHVLGKFTKDEKESVDKVIAIATLMIEDYLNMTFSNFMNKYNSNAS